MLGRSIGTNGPFMWRWKGGSASRLLQPRLKRKPGFFSLQDLLKSGWPGNKGQRPDPGYGKRQRCTHRHVPRPVPQLRRPQQPRGRGLGAGL